MLPSISSTARAPASLNSGTAAAAADSVGKNSSPVVSGRSSGQRVEDGLGDEAERALRADHQAAQDLDGVSASRKASRR